MPGVTALIEKFESEFKNPSIESMIVHLLLGLRFPWTTPVCKAVFERYEAQRGHRKGLRIPGSLETGLVLELAERSRLDGDLVSTRTLLSLAVEYLPGRKPIRELELEFHSDTSINWFEAIFPDASREDGGKR